MQTFAFTENLQYLCTRNAENLHKKTTNIKKQLLVEDLSRKQKLRKWFINKYTITMYLFAIIYIFIGDQSLVKRISKAKEIREIKNGIVLVNKETKQVETMLNSLNIQDSLERYAREQYKMHEDGEVVYLID